MLRGCYGKPLQTLLLQSSTELPPTGPKISGTDTDECIVLSRLLPCTIMGLWVPTLSEMYRKGITRWLKLFLVVVAVGVKSLASVTLTGAEESRPAIWNCPLVFFMPTCMSRNVGPRLTRWQQGAQWGLTCFEI